MNASNPTSQFFAPPSTIEVDCNVISPALVEMYKREIDTIAKTVPGGANNVQDIYPLSPLQEGMLVHHILNEQIDTYVLSALIQFGSREQVEAFLSALQTVIDRHDALRTSLLWEQLPRPLQVVCRRASLPVEELVLDQTRDSIEQLKERMRPGYRRLDVRHAPIMAVIVAADGHGANWHVLVQLHHVICDYQSLSILIAEAMACLDGRTQELPPPIAYRNYVTEALMQSGTAHADEFFRSKLGDITEPTAPFGLLDVHGDGSRIEEARVELDPYVAQRLRTQARCLKVSAARLFHAAFGLVVAHTSGREDVVFGTVVSAAHQRSARQQCMLGMSVNTLPLRLRLQGATTKELVEQTHREISELLKYEHASPTLARRNSAVAGNAPLFSAIFNYRRAAPDPEPQSARMGGVRVVGRRGVWTSYPVALLVDDWGGRVTVTAQTDQRVDPHRMAAYLAMAVQSLVESLEAAPQTPALALSILPPGERRNVSSTLRHLGSLV